MIRERSYPCRETFLLCFIELAGLFLTQV
eukprot:COSAG01_NODE_11258_length_1971_cov_2.103098_1_plen_28_part_10